MRKVKLTGAPPAEWVQDAEAVTQQLRAATDEAARNAIIDANQGLWRDDRIREWLLSQFNDKCWYSEAHESVSSIHVDHYRPKCRVKQELGGTTEDGYWWLAFDWTNYRICGQLLNVKKGDLFPIIEGVRCDANNPVSLHLEAPYLIDPLTDETCLISYDEDEDGVRAVVAAGIQEPESTRAEKTIEIMGLNLRDRLNRKRGDFWDTCKLHIADYKNAPGPYALRKIAQASAKTELKKMVGYDKEFSSVVAACVRKHAPEPLVAAVLDGLA